MKTSTSRDSSITHSTGNNDTMTKMNGHRQPRPRTSTGEGAAITHFTGRLFDFKRLEEAEKGKMAKQTPPQTA